jgi:hypothetical protein
VTDEPTSTTTAATVAEAPAAAPFDSRQTRSDFIELLNRHPREIGILLKLDPTLFRNDAWMAAYPELRAFVQAHPEVASSSSYFLEHVWIPGEMAPEPAAVRAARGAIEGIGVFFIILTIILAFAWLIRTMLEHRRWSRATRIQTDIQNKLLDRFTSHDDLVSYIQSSAGRDFLTSAVSPLPASAPLVSRPAARIVSSVQAGVVLFTIGLGLLVVSFRIHPDVASTVSGIGIMALAAGLGFVIAAIAGWVVARKLQLWSGETEATTSRTLTES